MTNVSRMSSLGGVRSYRSLLDGRWYSVPEVKVTNWKGELPSRPSGPGRERVPSPFDAVVLESFKSGTAKLIAGVGDPGSDERKSHVKELRRSAEFHKIGLDVWPDQPEGIVFLGREKRAKAAPAGAESSAA